MDNIDEIVDASKLLVATLPVGFTFLGLPIETWSFMVSITVGLFYLVEKLPSVIKSVKQMWRC